MANTATQLEVENWIRSEWLSEKFQQGFSKALVRLIPGGTFEADAVSQDESIVACVSTSGLVTSGKNKAVGNIRKVRSDLYFLLLIPADRQRLQIFTEPDMYQYWVEEMQKGRVPKEIQLLLVEIPLEWRKKLLLSKAECSKEISTSEYEPEN